MGSSGGTSGGGGIPSGTVTGPDAFGDAPSAGTAATYSRGDHNHGLPPAPAGGTPASAVVGPDAFGAAAAVGTSTDYARADHDHGLPAAPAGGTPADTVTGPDAYGAAAAVGTSTDYARADHDHGLPAAPAVPGAAGTVVGPDAFGATAKVGTSAAYARADHNHGLPANPAPAPATTVVGPDAFGDAAAVGSSAQYARADHNHGLPAASGGALTTLSGVLGATITPSAGGWTVVFTTPSLAVGTWLITFGACLASNNAASAYGVRVAAGTATATLLGQSAVDAYIPATSSWEAAPTATCLVTVTAPGTLVLSAYMSGAGAIRTTGANTSAANVTGWTAVKVA